MLCMSERSRRKKKVDQPAPAADRHTEPRFSFHLEADLLAALDDYCKAQEFDPGKSQVVRAAIRDYLQQKGFWPRRQRPS